MRCVAGRFAKGPAEIKTAELKQICQLLELDWFIDVVLHIPGDALYLPSALIETFKS